jgi:hypothetical protein
MSRYEHQRTIAALQAQIAALGPTLSRDQAPLPTGLPELDAHVKGWPVPGLTEISGRAGSGRILICLPSLARLSRHHRIGIVDPLGQLYPPGWTDVRLEQLLVLRPPLERAAWSAEQLARSGCFALVGLLDPPRLGRAAIRLVRASEHGACAMVIWTTEGDVRTPAKLRIQVFDRRPGFIQIHLPATQKRLWVKAPSRL